MQLKQKLGVKIRKLRKSKGLTIEELAFQCGVHYNYLGDIERGTRNPSLGSLTRIATGLGVEVRELLNAKAEDLPSNAEKDEYRITKQIFTLIKDKPLDKQKAILKLIKTLSNQEL